MLCYLDNDDDITVTNLNVNYHEAKDFVASVKWFTRLSIQK